MTWPTCQTACDYRVALTVSLMDLAVGCRGSGIVLGKLGVSQSDAWVARLRALAR